MNVLIASDSSRSLGSNPYLATITTRQYPIPDGPTRLTRGTVADATYPAAYMHETRWPPGGFPGRP